MKNFKNLFPIVLVVVFLIVLGVSAMNHFIVPDQDAEIQSIQIEEVQISPITLNDTLSKGIPAPDLVAGEKILNCWKDSIENPFNEDTPVVKAEIDYNIWTEDSGTGFVAPQRLFWPQLCLA